MEFVGRTVAVATAAETVTGTVAKVEEGLLHVKPAGGRTVAIPASEIVDLQVLESRSPAAPRAARDQTKPGRPARAQDNGPPKADSAQPARHLSHPQQKQSQPRQPAPRQQKPPQQKQLPQQQPQQPPKPHTGWTAKNGVAGTANRTTNSATNGASSQAPAQASARASGQASKQVLGQNGSSQPNAAHKPQDHSSGAAQGFSLGAPGVPVPLGSALAAQQPENLGASRTASTAHLPSASALQSVQVQSYMLGQGWSAAALSECAGRGIAAVAQRNIPGDALAGSAQHAATVVVLAGPHASGARALAAGRLIATRGGFVVAVLVDQAASPLDAELPAFKASGGVVASTVQALFAALERAAPVAVVVDALQGLERMSLEDQITAPEQLAASRWLVGWANSQRAARISIERISAHDNLALHATALVNCGWPLAGSSPSALAPASAAVPEVSRYVVDLGVPHAVLAALGLAHLYINFGNKFYVEVDN